MTEETAIVTAPPASLYLAPATTLDRVYETMKARDEYIAKALVSGRDFGIVPGTNNKPTLLKPGAEKLCSFFGLAPTFEDVSVVEDWAGTQHNGEVFIYYRQKCKLWLGDRMIASADGSCNSWEKKYRYRQADRVCPTCGKPAIFRSKQTPGWFCWIKKGGCGAQFKVDDQRITSQETGQIPNPDIAEVANTILKMAQKRALIAATLIATNASERFTQDMEDFVDGEYEESPAQQPTKPAAQASAEKKLTPNQAIEMLGFPPEPPARPALYAPLEFIGKGMTVQEAAMIEIKHKGSPVAMGVLDAEQLDKVSRYLLEKATLNPTEQVQKMAADTLLAPRKDR